MCCILVGNGPEKQYPTEYDYPYITLQLQQFLRLDCIWVWYRLVGSKQLLNSPYRLEGTVHDVSKEFIASSGIFVTEFPRTCIPSPDLDPPRNHGLVGGDDEITYLRPVIWFFVDLRDGNYSARCKEGGIQLRLGKILTKPEFGTTEGVQECPGDPGDPGTLGTPEPVAY